MSQILNQQLINACITEINSWKLLPKENHLGEPEYIDLSYKHILLSYTLKGIYDEGMEKSELAREIIMDLDYWPDATPYADWDEYDPSQQVPLTMNHWICPEVFQKKFANTSNGWALLAQYMIRNADMKDFDETFRPICIWNDPNGVWDEVENVGQPGHYSTAYVANTDQVICQIVLWAMEYKLDDKPMRPGQLEGMRT